MLFTASDMQQKSGAVGLSASRGVGLAPGFERGGETPKPFSWLGFRQMLVFRQRFRLATGGVNAGYR